MMLLPGKEPVCASKKRSGGGKRLIALLLVLAILLGGCVWYLETYYHADLPDIAAFSEGAGAEENRMEDGSLTFGRGDESFGLIFYPGGKVEHTAYVPLMRELAGRGVFCVLCEMPFRLAVLDPKAADGIPETFPEVRHWYLGGHSLGGVMAADYLDDHPEVFEGLILLASYTEADLSDSDLRVLSLYGSEDRVLNQDRYEEAGDNLPKDTREIVIPGGCHAYFGMYGAQRGDGIPTISAAEQIRFTAETIRSWLAETEEGGGALAQGD